MSPTPLRSGRRPVRLVAALVAALALGGTSVAAASADEGLSRGDTPADVRVSGTLHADTPGEVVYEAIKPADWNGTLILDLDFNRWSDNRREYFLDAGYAIGGNERTQNETAYEITTYVDNLVTTRDALVEAVEEAGASGTPDRTIAWGNSRGGFVARMAAQYRPDVFDGAIGSAGGGAGVLASWLGKVDAVWALQQLVDPDAGLAINDLPDIPDGASYGSDYEEDVKLGDLVDEASGSEQGLARIVLAGAFEQATDFPEGDAPPASDDFHTQGLNIASGFAFGNPQFVHKEIEVMAGGPVAWNHGIDYRDLLNRSGARERVEWWYAHAGLDLEADLDALNAAPRYAADPDAVSTVEEIGTYDGTGSPVITIKTLGDSADPAPLDEAYRRTFEASGNADELLRTLLIERSGHGGQTFGEHLAAFRVLEQRLDTGEWPDVSPASMNGRVAELPEETGLPAEMLGGEGRYISFDGLPPALRTWDATDWGDYDGVGAPAWEAGTAYTDGDVVAYEDRLYEAQWWTRGDTPGRSTSSAWADLGVPGVCGAGTFPVWTNSQIYDRGDRVSHAGRVFEAQWWTRDDEPGGAHGAWADRGSC